MAQPAHFLWLPTKGIKTFSRSFCSSGAREQPSNKYLAWFGRLSGEKSPQPMGREPSTESLSWENLTGSVKNCWSETVFRKYWGSFRRDPVLFFHSFAAQASRISFAAYLVNSICSILITVAVLILISCFRIRLSVICPRFLYRWFVS